MNRIFRKNLFTVAFSTSVKGIFRKNLFTLAFMGSRDGAVVRALASHLCVPDSIPTQSHMWVEFVVVSRPCSEGFSPGSPEFQFHQDRGLA